MPFESLEKRPSISEKKDESREKLETILGKLAEGLGKLGFPIDTECRIKPEVFSKIIPSEEIKRDLKYVGEMEEKFSAEDKSKEKKGELLEMYVTLLLNKYLNKEKFAIVRTSRYDDIKNGADHLFLDIKTGEVVGIFDVVSAVGDERHREKTQNFFENNLGKLLGGTEIKYGIGIKKEDGKILFEPRSYTKTPLPLFCLALSPEELETAIKKFNSPEKEDREYERKMALYFLLCLQYQCELLEKKELVLKPTLYEKVKHLKENLDPIVKKHQEDLRLRNF